MRSAGQMSNQGWLQQCCHYKVNLKEIILQHASGNVFPRAFSGPQRHLGEGYRRFGDEFALRQPALVEFLIRLSRRLLPVAQQRTDRHP